MVRIVTLNIWQEQGPWLRRLRLITERLKRLDPDVVCLQEVREVGDKVPNQAETLAASLGFRFTFEPVQEWGGGMEGLAILTRLPLRSRDACELPYSDGRSRRVCLGAELETDAGSFWTFTTHLAWRMGDGALREKQVVAVDRFVRSHAASHGASSILTGDFNATPDADEIRYLKGLTSLGQETRSYFQDAFAAKNPDASGHTWTRENPYTETLSWLERDRRLDYIFVTTMTRDGAGQIHECRLVCTEPDSSGIYCSDHYGVLAEVTVHGDKIKT